MATVAALAAASPSSALSFSTAAMEATKMAGWDTSVVSRRALGPSTHRASKSYLTEKGRGKRRHVDEV
jgi:hypothetical protein